MRKNVYKNPVRLFYSGLSLYEYSAGEHWQVVQVLGKG